MKKITALSQEVIAKIAAGEVIERPAYAVKELIDNALDAGASAITIYVEESGLKRIVVQDNGEGMSKEDLVLCFLPHTTSKLKNVEDLLGVTTFGFRGEALSSIAAISNMTIKSRTPDASGGSEIAVRAGEIEAIRPVGMPVGTIVTVGNLFYNVPARKKFLKTAKTEFRHITDIVMQYALIHSNVHFLLTHDKKTVLDLPAFKNASDRIQSLLGIDVSVHLVPVTIEQGFITLHGFVGKPQIASKQNQKQFLFVNHRHVTDKQLAQAVREAYGTLLPASSTPLFVLHLSLPHEAVDVNVHPRKEQVALSNAASVTDAVKQGVQQALSSHNLVYNFSKLKQELSAKVGETQSFAGTMLRDAVLPWNTGELKTILKEAPVVQLHNIYIMTVTEDGFILIDQHAAHERILYEQFVESFEKAKQKQEQYHLAKPLSLELSVTDVQILEEHSTAFEQLGFQIEHFQGNTFVIRAIPAVFRGRNIQKIIADMLVDLGNETSKSIDTKTQRMLAFLSCRAAVKAGDALTNEQCKKLVEQLEETKNNTTCPHGRPTKILITLEELHRLFKRR